MSENSLLISQTEAKDLEKFHVDHRVRLTNASASFLLKNHFAKYFQDTYFKPSSSENDQLNCMEKVYKLVCTFESLERLIANSASADPAAAQSQLITAVNKWKEHFVGQLDELFPVTTDARTTALACKIKTDINRHTALFVNSIEQPSDFNIHQRYARHDLGMQMSLGHLIALNLDAVLSSGLRLSYHYSPHSIMNLWYVDRAIASLSNAKSELRLQNFSLEGRIKISAIHPFDKSMMARLNPQNDKFYTKYAYLPPANNPTAAERLLKIKASSTANLYASTYIQTFIKVVCSILDLIFLSLVVLNVLNYIVLNGVNLLTLNHYEKPIIQLYKNYQDFLTKIYTYLSPLEYFRADENDRINTHVGFTNLPKSDQDFFKASLVKKNYIQTLIDDLSFKPTATVSPISLAFFKDKHLNFQKPNNLQETINHTEFNPRNEFSSPVEIMGELSILLNDGIESCFRSSPVVSTAGFCASLLTLFAYLNPALIIPGTKFLMIKLQQLIDMTNMAFCGEAASTGLSQEIIGIFLTWQLNGVFLDLPLWPLQERLGFAADYTHQMSVYITKFALLCGLSFTIGQLHPVNINWAKLSPFHWFNVVCQSSLNIVSNFINLIIEETNICANGAPILSYFSRVLFTLKGCLILKDWLSSNKPVEHERHPADNAEHERHRADNAERNPLTLQTYLYLLETGHQELLEASQQREFAIEFYLELKKTFDDYNRNKTTKIDADILLDAYFNLYCQSNYLNYCKLLIVPYILLTIAELLAGHLYYAMSSEPDKRALSEIYTIRARKNMEGMLLIGIQVIYYPLYMLDAFIRMIWNYLIIGVIRAPVTLIGATFAFFENYHNWKSTQSYILLCQIDDSIANFKIKHQLCQLLQPLYGLIANLARSTAVYHDLRGIAACLLTQISNPDLQQNRDDRTLIN